MVESALCYGLITFANKHLPATVVTAFWPVQVPVAVVLASCPVGIFDKRPGGSDVDMAEEYGVDMLADESGSGSAAGAVGPFCETLTSMELLGGVLIAVGLIAVTCADNMERKEVEAMKKDMPPLLGTYTVATVTHQMNALGRISAQCGSTHATFSRCHQCILSNWCAASAQVALDRSTMMAFAELVQTVQKTRCLQTDERAR